MDFIKFPDPIWRPTRPLDTITTGTAPPIADVTGIVEQRKIGPDLVALMYEKVGETNKRFLRLVRLNITNQLTMGAEHEITAEVSQVYDFIGVSGANQILIAIRNGTQLMLGLVNFDGSLNLTSAGSFFDIGTISPSNFKLGSFSPGEFITAFEDGNNVKVFGYRISSGTIAAMAGTTPTLTWSTSSFPTIYGIDILDSQAAILRYYDGSNSFEVITNAGTDSISYSASPLQVSQPYAGDPLVVHDSTTAFSFNLIMPSINGYVFSINPVTPSIAVVPSANNPLASPSGSSATIEALGDQMIYTPYSSSYPKLKYEIIYGGADDLRLSLPSSAPQFGEICSGGANPPISMTPNTAICIDLNYSLNTLNVKAVGGN